MIGVSRRTLWRMVRDGTFPQPVRVTERNVGYVLEAVEAWMQARTQGPTPEPATEGTGGPSEGAVARRTSGACSGSTGGWYSRLGLETTLPVCFCCSDDAWLGDPAGGQSRLPRRSCETAFLRRRERIGRDHTLLMGSESPQTA
jgi:hypothetical protein